LSDNNGAGADDEYGFDRVIFGHDFTNCANVRL